MFCNVNPEARHHAVLIHPDLDFCVLVFLLSFSVGFIGNNCLTMAPKMSADPASQEATSLTLTATFVLGQATGSFMSFFILEAV